MQYPKYVVVFCKHFNSGLPGWRLNEVSYYCFASNYDAAKLIVEKWNTYKNYNEGLSFMIKYENWIKKGGSPIDGLPLAEIRYLY